MIWYKVERKWVFNASDIVETPITSTTKTRVYTKDGKNEAKVTQFHQYFETYTEAYSFMVDRMLDRIEMLEEDAKTVRARLAEFRRSQRLLRKENRA
jgi:hypothetical protein